LSARNKYKKSKLEGSRAVRREIAAAEKLYAKQLAKRIDYMLKAEGRMDEKWTRRYLLPTSTAEYAKWKHQPRAHQGDTVVIRHPEVVDPKDTNPSGLKHEQYFPFGDKGWSAAMGMRNHGHAQWSRIRQPQSQARAVRGPCQP
jgi:hypothetical protein